MALQLGNTDVCVCWLDASMVRAREGNDALISVPPQEHVCAWPPGGAALQPPSADDMGTG